MLETPTRSYLFDLPKSIAAPMIDAINWDDNRGMKPVRILASKGGAARQGMMLYSLRASKIVVSSWFSKSYAQLRTPSVTSLIISSSGLRACAMRISANR